MCVTGWVRGLTPNVQLASSNLNTKDVGFTGTAPESVYINESLSPARRLLAVARAVKRLQNYTYLWVPNGKISMMKNQGYSVIVITFLEQIDILG
ncbi:hypothetical protein J6590_096314 [Homalodisca vitripennis]|nr:hypothetical protein J6590_096314 [Homalodisca vitripennis]